MKTLEQQKLPYNLIQLIKLVSMQPMLMDTIWHEQILVISEQPSVTLFLSLLYGAVASNHKIDYVVNA